MEFFGVEVTGDHARLIVPVIGGLLAFGGFVAGRWSRHRAHVNFKREDLVASSIAVELYGIAPEPDGSEMLHIVTLGRVATLQEFFSADDLVRHVKKAAAKHPGLLQIRNQIAHRMMMDVGKDIITGLDARANMDFVHGRPTQDDETLFGFASYAEHNHDGSVLHDQIGRLVLMVVSPTLVQRLADAAYIKNLRVRHSGYLPRRERLHDFAREWLRLQGLPPAQRSSGSDKIWQVTVRTSSR